MSGSFSILVVGDRTRGEFASVVGDLEASRSVEVVGEIVQAERRLRTADALPELVVLAQSYPGEFSPRAVEGLRRLAPLARIVGLLGSWCEGEARSGEPWPAVPRVYWHQWTRRASRELPRRGGGGGASWQLPPTASEEERLLAVSPVDWAMGQGLVAVRTSCFEMAELMTDLLCRAGYGAVWLEPWRPARLTGLSAVLFDGDDLRGDGFAELGRLVAVHRPVPVLALLDFPRTDDVARAREAGAAGVVSKPFLLDEFLDELARAIGAGSPSS